MPNRRAVTYESACGSALIHDGFSDWEINSRVTDERAGKIALAIITDFVRRELSQAFGEFAANGSWYFWEESLQWIDDGDPVSLWGGEFPVALTLCPATFIESFRRYAAEYAEDQEQMRASLARWRDAISECERICDAKGGEHGGE